MNQIESWFIKRVFKREVKQGNHHRKVKRLLVMLSNEVRAEFTEDNRPTFEDFMKVSLSDALAECDT